MALRRHRVGDSWRVETGVVRGAYGGDTNNRADLRSRME